MDFIFRPEFWTAVFIILGAIIGGFRNARRHASDAKLKALTAERKVDDIKARQLEQASQVEQTSVKMARLEKQIDNLHAASQVMQEERAEDKAKILTLEGTIEQLQAQYGAALAVNEELTKERDRLKEQLARRGKSPTGPLPIQGQGQGQQIETTTGNELPPITDQGVEGTN